MDRSFLARSALLVGIGALALADAARAEVLALYDMGPTVPGVRTPTAVAGTVTATNLTEGPGLSAFDFTSPATAPPSAPFLRTTFVTTGTTADAAVANNAYFQFTVNAAGGFVMNLSSLTIDVMRGGGSTPRGTAIYSNVDGFATALYSADIPTVRPTFTPVAIDLTGAPFQGLTTITFRVYGYSPATGSSMDYDNFILNGSTAAVGTYYIWSGAVNGNWDLSTANWTGVGTIYSDGVNVLFNDTATGTTTINVTPASVAPQIMTLSNTVAKPYTFGGNPIAAVTAISKTGDGPVTVNNAISAPLVQFDAGTVTFSATGALGATTSMSASGNVIFNSAAQTLSSLGGTSTGVVSLNGTTLTITGSGSSTAMLTGTGSIIKTTGGSQSLSGSSNHTGGNIINGGILRLDGALAAGTGVTRVDPGGSLALGANLDASAPVTLAGGTAGSAGGNFAIGGDVTAQAATTSVLLSAEPGSPGLSRDTIILGVLHGTGDLNITAATGQGNPDGGGGVRLRNVTTNSDYNGIIEVKPGGKLEIRSSGGNFSAAGTARIRMHAGNINLNPATGAYTQLNLRTNATANYGNDVEILGTGFVNIFTGLFGAIVDAAGASMGTLKIGDQQTVNTNSGDVIVAYLLRFNAVQLQGGVAGFTPGGTLTANGQDISLGPISEAVAGSSIVKSGVNQLILTGTNTYTGTTTVNSGTLLVTGTINTSTGLTVAAGATFIASGAHSFTLNGNITNDGTMIIRSGAHLAAGGATTFVNNGVLDLISGSATLPPGFVNGPTGIVLDSSLNKITSITRAGTLVTLTMDSYTGHTYQLQSSTQLSNGWTNVGTPQTGTTGVPLTFFDDPGPIDKFFYRVAVDP